MANIGKKMISALQEFESLIGIPEKEARLKYLAYVIKSYKNRMGGWAYYVTLYYQPKEVQDLIKSLND